MPRLNPLIAVAVKDAARAFFLREGSKTFLRWNGKKVEERPVDAAMPFKPSFVSWCWVTRPEPGLLSLNWPGQFCFITADDLRVTGNLWQRCMPAPTSKRYGDTTRLALIG